MPATPPRLPVTVLVAVLIACYTTAAALPCGAVPKTAADGFAHAEPHAAIAENGDHPGHVGHAGHAGNHGSAEAHAAADTGAGDTALTAACPCGCGDSPQRAGGASPRIGWGLDQRQPSIAWSPYSAALAASEPQAPADPEFGSDTVPI